MCCRNFIKFIDKKYKNVKKMEEYKMKKQSKLLLMILTVVIVIMSIFVTTQIPSTNPKIKDLPIAIVNKDSGELSM